MSELPTSKPSDAPDQLARMHTVLQHARTLGVRPAVAMMSSTEGVLSHPEMDLDAVDPGALFVGLPDSNTPARPVKLRHALKAISTSLIAVKRLDGSLGPVPAIPGVESEKGCCLRPTWSTYALILPKCQRLALETRSYCWADKAIRSSPTRTLPAFGAPTWSAYGKLRDHIPRIYTGNHNSNSREELK
ncbi:hypothetical protein P6U16_22530 (plasmid) [Rhizobium sp. 32-5/1]|uniref:hypothetical protein n=1 Tax=Rhizobium sp. 32-5/1 TaxID=3019602 RepID=UPI00240D88D1|nr:hypothetical protein [Rhizobium sp. 32-5/1]WEZ85803.1 hypothetical protein P6U16_22530 [Rhizobium sp. 32-5/1]